MPGHAFDYSVLSMTLQLTLQLTTVDYHVLSMTIKLSVRVNANGRSTKRVERGSGRGAPMAVVDTTPWEPPQSVNCEVKLLKQNADLRTHTL